MNFFLRIKHWQLFLFFLALSMVLQVIILFVVLYFDIETDSLPFIAGIICFEFFLLWIFGLAKALNKRLPPDLQSNTGKLRLLLLIPALNAIAFFFFVLWISSMSMSEFQMVINILIITQLGVAVCTFFILVIICRSLRTAELSREAQPAEYFIDIILFIVFFPIGIWLLQPRINRIFRQN